MTKKADKIGMKVPHFTLPFFMAALVLIASLFSLAPRTDKISAPPTRHPSSELLTDPFDTRKAAEYLVAKIRPTTTVSGQALEREIDNLSVLMRVPFEELENIERYGLLNIHETLQSKGGYDPRLRLRGEQILLGSSESLEDAPRSLLPKSGYLYFESEALDIFARAPESYGEIIITFRPDVHQRTTYTVGDSSNHAHRVGRASAPLSDLGPLKQGLSQLRADDKYIDYFEALIWGDLNIDDIENIFIPEDMPKKKRAKVEELARRRGLGFGVYQYDIPEYKGDLLEAHLYNKEIHTKNPKLFPLKKYVDTNDTKRSTAEVFQLIFESNTSARTPFSRPSHAALLERLQKEISLSEKFIIYQRMIYHDEHISEQLYSELEALIKKKRVDMFDKEAMLNSLRSTRPLNTKNCHDLIKLLL